MAGAISGFADNSHCGESRRESSVDPRDALSESASSCGSCNGGGRQFQSIGSCGSCNISSCGSCNRGKLQLQAISSRGSCNGRAIPLTAYEIRTGLRLTDFACQPVGFSLANHRHWREDESIVQDDSAILGVIRTLSRTLWNFDGEGIAVTCLIISTRPALRPAINRQTGLISFTQEHYLAWRGCRVWQYVTKSYPLN